MWGGSALKSEEQDSGSFGPHGPALGPCGTQASDPLCPPVALSCVSALFLLLSSGLAGLGPGPGSGPGSGPRGALTALYRLLGHLCASTGAVLSRQLQIQVVWAAFAASLDAVAFLSCCLPVCLCWNSEEGRVLRMRRRRRRQCVLSVSVLMVLGGGFLRAGVGQSSADVSLPVQRRLFSVSPEARSDILGYTLGILSFVIACTSRFPTLHRASQGHTLPRAHAVSVVMRSLSGAFYAAAILLSDTHYAFLLRVMPWLLSAVSGIILDLLLGLLHLLNLCSGAGISCEEKPTVHNKQEVHSTAQTKMKSFLKATDMGRYIDVIAQPICLKEISVSKETEDRSANGVERLIRVDSFYSDTSLDSSTVGSDLEWDFEEVSVQWSEPAGKPQDRTERLPSNSLQPINI
ncbi:transmembrane protein 44 [Sphaeramia orbicularis]|uniref:transmembrane protein 44 n=1 Tax=Sphaeramia orbicularis TaxID=375764 RepID=UPI0011805EC0|nr:transmembrane protein 44 [Sphaeramia orbicularis]